MNHLERGLGLNLYFMPHGACWLWDWKLILLHGPADFITFLSYSIIPIVCLFVYRTGRLQDVQSAFPGLWLWGAGFVLFCGLSHLGSFLEIWFGGWVYWITGINKIIMATFSAGFAIQFFYQREKIALFGRILSEVHRQGLEESGEVRGKE